MVSIKDGDNNDYDINNDYKDVDTDNNANNNSKGNKKNYIDHVKMLYEIEKKYI